MKSKLALIERSEGVSTLAMATKLSFRLYPSSEFTGGDLETAFIQFRCSQALNIDRLLGLGKRALPTFFVFRPALFPFAALVSAR